MTDEQIIKALKELLEIMLHEGDLQRSSTISNTIDLINRQHAEIAMLKSDLKLKTNDYELLKRAYEQAENVSVGRKDRLMQKVVELQEARKEIERLTTMNSELNIGIKKLKEFAVKGFVKRLKELPSVTNCEYEWLHLDIDNLVKEMTNPVKLEHNSLCETETYVKE